MTTSATGTAGLDRILGGGLPTGRVTLLMGGAGSGKTVLGTQILANGARHYEEPGLFVGFEEGREQVLAHTDGFGWGFRELVDRGLVELVDAQLEPEVVQAGEFDLRGLLAGIEAKTHARGSRRVVLDGIDVLLDLLGEPPLIRRELFRLRSWLLDSGMTAILTAKSGEDGSLRPDYDFLQYLADCVVVCSHRLVDRTATRGLRVWKLRGRPHSANEHPFVIERRGIDVATGAETAVEREASDERVTTGMDSLDGMMDGGYYRGSAVLITGAPGTAKTTLSASFAAAACARGERTLYASLDEGAGQILRNIRSVGIDLEPHVSSGLLHIESLQSRAAEPQYQASRIRTLLEEHRADCLVIDPLSAFVHTATFGAAETAALDLIALAKARGVTVVATSLITGSAEDQTDLPAIGLSTVADTWLHLSYKLQGGERNRALSVVKSRGTAHSSQMRELVLHSSGVTLADVYTAGGEVLMGTLRWEKERENEERRVAEQRETERRKQELRAKLSEMDARIEGLRQQHASLAGELEILEEEQQHRDESRAETRRQVAELRGTGDGGRDGNGERMR